MTRPQNQKPTTVLNLFGRDLDMLVYGTPLGLNELFLGGFLVFDELPPEDPGLIPLTAAEIKRVVNLVTRAWQSIRHYLHWSWWRRRHQARARWFHHRARLRRQAAAP